MSPRKNDAALIMLLLLVLGLNACYVPTNPAPPGLPTPTTGIPSAAPTQAPSPTATTAQSQPTTPPPTEAPTQATPGSSSAPIITAENAASLTPTSLTLPESPTQLLWVPNGASLPAGLSSAGLLVRSENKYYPIQLDPPALGQGIMLNIPGQVMAFAPDLSSVITRADSGKLDLYRLDGTLIYTFDAPDPYGAGYSADGKLVIITSANEHAVTLYDTVTGKAQARLTGFESAAPVYGAGIVPGNQVIYWIARATLQFQDVASQQMGAKLSYQDFIGSTAFSPDGQRLYLYVESKLFIIKAPSGEEQTEVTLSQPVSSLSLSPDGKLLASGYGPNLQIWKADTLAPIATLPGPNTFTGGVTLSPDGRYLASIHEGNLVNIWRVKTP